MTKAILYILLIAYSVNLVKPVLPYINDAVSHICWYSKHMSTVHLENGKYHVHVEVMAAAKKTDLPVSNTGDRTGKVLSEHVNSVYEYDFPLKSLAVVCFSYFTSSLPSPFTDNDYAPPRI